MGYVQREPHAAGRTLWLADVEVLQPLTGNDADIKKDEETEESTSFEFAQDPFRRLRFALRV